MVPEQGQDADAHAVEASEIFKASLHGAAVLHREDPAQLSGSRECLQIRGSFYAGKEIAVLLFRLHEDPAEGFDIGLVAHVIGGLFHVGKRRQEDGEALGKAAACAQLHKVRHRAVQFK